MDFREDIAAVAAKNHLMRSRLINNVNFNLGIHKIPVLNLCSIYDLVDFFQVKRTTIEHRIKKYIDEFGLDEVALYTCDAIRKKLIDYGYFVQNKDSYGFFYKDDDDKQYEIARYQQFYFSTKGVLRIALMLPESKAAKEIRDILIEKATSSDLISSFDNDYVTRHKGNYSKEEKELLYSENARNSIIKKITGYEKEIVDSVKHLKTMQDFNFVTVNMIASYLEVKPSTIFKAYRQNIFEFDSVAIVTKPMMFAVFSPMAIIKFAMLIKNSEIAHKIREEVLQFEPSKIKSNNDILIEKKKIELKELEKENAALKDKRDNLKNFLNSLGTGVSHLQGDEI